MAIIVAQLAISGLGSFRQVDVRFLVNSLATLSNSIGTLSQIGGSLTKRLTFSQQSNFIRIVANVFLITLGQAQQGLMRLDAGYSRNIRLGEYQIYWSRLARFFGLNVKQDANFLYIKKSDLPRLSPQAINTAESLFAAMLIHVMTYESNSLVSRATVERWKTERLLFNNLAVVRVI